MIYAGIGSRETPPHILQLMEQLGFMLCYQGWTLRSGYAQGADRAFYQGYCAAPGPGKVENYLPWNGFNQAHHDGDRFFSMENLNHPLAMQIAQGLHPNWRACKPAARLLLARNSFQILGRKLDDPCKRVICWTPGAKGGGGTGQALRLAGVAQVPVHDLADPSVENHFREEVRKFFSNL